jgi:aryl carrier-like protein|tara:strand:+ start:514 stop:744 length:231 start_codon:yes stop_codon:yes gene_type:complete
MKFKSPISESELKLEIKALIPFHDEDIESNDNLLELGVDSMGIMQLVNKLRSQGHEVTFSILIEAPTLADWHKQLN